jgi:hypothetical protein
MHQQKSVLTIATPIGQKSLPVRVHQTFDQWEANGCQCEGARPVRVQPQNRQKVPKAQILCHTRFDRATHIGYRLHSAAPTVVLP